MNEIQFCYWLKGFFELTEVESLSDNQVIMIKNHLNLVFNKVTPSLEGTEFLTHLKKDERLTGSPLSPLPTITC